MLTGLTSFEILLAIRSIMRPIFVILPSSRFENWKPKRILTALAALFQEIALPNFGWGNCNALSARARKCR
jgi:hypothetical protein